MRRALALLVACSTAACSFDLAPLADGDGAVDSSAVDSAIDSSALDSTRPDTLDAADGNADDAIDSTTVDSVIDTAVDSTADSGTDASDTVDAPATCPAGMIRVPLSGIGRSFCIDAKEVTAGAYKTWVDTSPATTGQPTYCSWNTTFVPQVDTGYPSGWYPPDATHANDPVRWVDWCDAAAYCKAAGKHLCGAFGGGPITFTAVGDATKSAWMAACSADGTRAYPYGASYDPAKCNGKDAGAMYPTVGGAFIDCVGGYPGLYDMSGNVHEWEDNCAGATGASDVCYSRGGSYGTGTTAKLSCNGSEAYTRNTTSLYTGFRCCKE